MEPFASEWCGRSLQSSLSRLGLIILSTMIRLFEETWSYGVSTDVSGADLGCAVFGVLAHATRVLLGLSACQIHRWGDVEPSSGVKAAAYLPSCHKGQPPAAWASQPTSTFYGIQGFHEQGTMASLASSPIASKATECLKLFHGLTDVSSDWSAPVHGIDHEHVLEQLGHFQMWANNIGALQRKNITSSLDHRLREAPQFVAKVVSLLDDLSETLEDGMNLLSSSQL